jgi:NifU-like protein involved in Fe-S cluster formation
MLDDIYNARILDFAGKLCGSKVAVSITMDGDRVTGFAHEVKACALGQASSSIMARHVLGATADEIRTARADMLLMLKEGGDGPTGRFEDMRYLKPVKDYKARHASTMLTFDAVVDAISQIEAGRAEAQRSAVAHV